tara:strand:+ start:13076 stop:13963 length:888 start_codon:yes stop_codon:yes gene_type:complete
MGDTFQRQGATAFLQDVWTEAVLNYAEVNYKLRNSITDFTSLTDGNVGEKVYVPTLGAETAINYTGIDGSSDDASVTFSNDTDGQVEINCNLQPAIGKRISNVVQVQASFDIFDGMARSMGQGIAKYIESAIKVYMATDTTNTAVNMSSSTTVTDAEYEAGVQSAMAILLGKDVPLDDGDLYLYCSPSMYTSLLKSDDFSHASLRGDSSNPNATGVIGSIYGANVVSSSLWDNGTLADGEVEGTLFHKTSMGCAFSIEPHVQAQENVAYLSTDLVASCCFGASVINGDLISNIAV